MSRKVWLLIAGLFALAALSKGTVMIVSAAWKRAKNADKYLPLLHAAEISHRIPTDLLARLAYQESRFRDDIVTGKTVSSAGAKGIMQLVPLYHPTVDPLNVSAAINYAANFLSTLHTQLGTWEKAVAGYNAGAGNVKKYGGIPPFAETQNYVSQIFADVPDVNKYA